MVELSVFVHGKKQTKIFQIECVGDDIAWMKFDASGRLRAINPENGFFGVAPGTSQKTNPNALKACMSNTVFTNVAETSDGGVYWEGMDDIPKGKVTSWLGEEWTPGMLCQLQSQKYPLQLSISLVTNFLWKILFPLVLCVVTSNGKQHFSAIIRTRSHCWS